MCKKTGKRLFVSGCGLQMLTYYIATNYTFMNVVNGKGRGGDMRQARVPRGPLAESDFFLDSATGDYYRFDQLAKKWIPVGNTGLHSRLAAEEFGRGGNYVLRPRVYHIGKQSVEAEIIYTQTSDERIIRVKKPLLRHWTVRDLSPEFRARCTNIWEPHPVNLVNIRSVGENYRLVADSDRGPQIVTHENTLAVQFHVSHRYPETMQVLRNFVFTKLSEIQVSASSVSIDYG